MKRCIFILVLGALQSVESSKTRIVSMRDSFVVKPIDTQKCYPDQLHPLFKIKWNHTNFYIYQVFDTMEEHHTFWEFKQVSAVSSPWRGVMEWIRPNLSSFILLLNAQYFHAKMEITVEKRVENLSKLVENRGKTIANLLKDDLTSSQEEDLFSFWNLTIKFIEDFLNCEFITNCQDILPLNSGNTSCTFQMAANFHRSFDNIWVLKGKIESLSTGGMIIVLLETPSMKKDPLRLEIHWTILTEGFSQFSATLFIGTQSYLSFKIDFTWTDGMSLSMELSSVFFDWRVLSYWTVQYDQNGKTISSVTDANYHLNPIPDSIKYNFQMTENNSSTRILELRHNISSSLYLFEGNMTVHVKPSPNLDPVIITEITQTIRTPLSTNLRLDLKQIFNQCGHWSWETVVMKSGLFDMHVNGKWNYSVLDYYRKRFHFHSHDEDSFTSFDLILKYSKRVLFVHQIFLPFLARSYDISIQYPNEVAFFPDRFEIRFRDEFESNISRSIGLLTILREEELWTLKTSSEWPEVQLILSGVNQQIKKLVNWIDDENHPINLILKPVFRRPTISIAFAEIFKWIKT